MVYRKLFWGFEDDDKKLRYEELENVKEIKL